MKPKHGVGGKPVDYRKRGLGGRLLRERYGVKSAKVSPEQQRAPP